MGVGGQRHAPAALPPRKDLGAHCTGGWVGPRAGLDGCGEDKISCHTGGYLKAAEEIKMLLIPYVNANNFNNKLSCRFHSRSISILAQEKPYFSTVAYKSFLAGGRIHGESCISVRATKITNCSRITN